MRYMTGGSLYERIHKATLTINQVAHIFIRLAEALDYAHRKGVVHRDLKPGNILFDEINNAFIADFGIAKFTQAATRITNSGILGTPRYISPEQALGEEADGRSDQYSLAVILFEILSGRAPFEAKTPLALALKHATEPPPDILGINPKLPKALSNVMMQALEKEPDKRYSTCVEFVNAFLEALPESSKSTEGLATPLPSWIYKHTESPTELPVQTTLSPSQTRSHIRLGIEFTLAALLGVAIWGFPRFTATPDAPTSTPQAVTATSAPATLTQVPPTPTNTPTETLEPAIVPVVPNIGGATDIAFTSNRDIYVMGIDGKNPTQVTNTNITKFDLQWLPGGQDVLYAEGKCVYKVNVETPETGSEEIACFIDQYFEGFRVSPDGSHVAISIGRRLLILPFDLELLATAKTTVDLQKSENICIDYSEVTVKSAQWSSDGRSLAIHYHGAVGNLNRLGEAVRIIDVDLVRCEAVDPVLIDEFPGTHFTPEGYVSNPALPSFHWDGDERFVFNTYIRNGGYGELYLYNMITQEEKRINPVNGICCYRSAALSPDGNYILFAFQNIGEGSESRIQLYYVPLDASEPVLPFRLPLGYFTSPRENILFSLRPQI
jgi:serine/threonine protein kinase